MTLSKCAICRSKKCRFIKHQEAKGLLSKLGIKTPLSKIPILGDILFLMRRIKWMLKLINFYWQAIHLCQKCI